MAKQYFIEREQGGERAILVFVTLQNFALTHSLREFKELALASGLESLSLMKVDRSAPQAKFYIGRGKVSELQEQVRSLGAEVVIFNVDLSPAQERNLEHEIRCRVVSRTGLILDIFAQRARSYEGRLQVELAQLQHLSTRLIRGWTHLERQKGGIGLRGPGETQLETDRRLLAQKIKSIKLRLAKVAKQRDQSRRGRHRSGILTVVLVGYTNAGKSTLFNCLTGSDVYVEDKLFATLDPTLRQIELPGLTQLVLADTVGFIRDLPHDLVAAFRATLEEAAQADLLIHVIDACAEDRLETELAVEEVLREIGADHVPCLRVYNKIDQKTVWEPRLDHDEGGQANCVWVSALEQAGMDLLTQGIIECLHEQMVVCTWHLSPMQSKLRAQLYELGAVQNEQITEDGSYLLELLLMQVDYQRLWEDSQQEEEPPLPDENESAAS